MGSRILYCIIYSICLTKLDCQIILLHVYFNGLIFPDSFLTADIGRLEDAQGWATAAHPFGRALVSALQCFAATDLSAVKRSDDQLFE